jgi:hypothetical protein
MLIFGHFITFYLDQSTPKNWGFMWPFLQYGSFDNFNSWIPSVKWHHMSPFRRPSVNRFGLHVQFSTPVANQHDFGKFGFFGLIDPLKLRRGCKGLNRHKSKLFDISTTKIRPYLPVDIGIEGEKSGETQKCMSSNCPDDLRIRSLPNFARLVVWTR